MEAYIPKLLIAIPALPLLAAVVVAVLGKRVLREQSHWPVVLALAGSCLASVFLIFAVQQAEKNHRARASREALDLGGRGGSGEQVRSDPVLSTQTLSTQSASSALASVPALSLTPAFRMDIVLRADSLTAIMLGMVTFISTLVVIYASGYMHGDPGYWRFFAYVALFVFSMTMLVSVSNFVLLYVFWEAVGLCSYLLIGFWFEKPAAAAAGMKAFLVNRVGDCGFALGVFLLWTTFGTLNFHDSKVETVPATTAVAATTVVHVDPQEIEDPNIPGTVEHGIFGHLRLTQDHTLRRRRRHHGHLPAVVRGRLRQERPVPAARLAAGRDGRPHAGQRLDPRGDDGHGRRLPGRPLYAAVCGCALCPGSGCHDRRLHGPAGRADRPDANRFEADPGLFDRQPARIHVPGPGHGQPARRDRRHVPPVHARLLQGPACSSAPAA